MSKARRGREAASSVPEEDDNLSGFIDDETYAKVNAVQSKIIDVEKEQTLQVLKIQHDHDRLKAPFFSERAEIFKTIPEFWLKILSRHPKVSPYLQEKNTNDAFKTLQDVNVEDVLTDKTSGYKLTLSFGVNQFFSNKSLEITVTRNLNTPESEANPLKVEATKIAWKPGKNIVDQVDAQNKKKGEENDDDDEILTFFSLLNSDPNLAYIHDMPAPSVYVFNAIQDDIFFDPIAFYKNDLVFGDGEDEPSDSESEDDDEEGVGNEGADAGDHDDEDEDETKGTKKSKKSEGDDDDDE